MAECPCGSGLSDNECCGPFISGERTPDTAEQMMRSRYTAYTRAAVKYILATTHPEHRDQYDEASTREWAENSDWRKLEIINTTAGTAEDTDGEVEFIATYAQDGQEYGHHERAEFKKKDGKWYFWDGHAVAQKPVKRQGPKIGRNDPCPCGSGKKYKKCCGR